MELWMLFEILLWLEQQGELLFRSLLEISKSNLKKQPWEISLDWKNILVYIIILKNKCNNPSP